MNKNKKIRIIIISLSFILLGSHYLSNKEHTHNIYLNEELVDEPLYFRSCSAGDIYIGTPDDFINYGMPNGIIVIDKRDDEDPDMVISSSYKIDNKQEICEILQILESYNNLYPSKWSRTLESMKNEWDVHNILYDVGYNHLHTTDVDLDNDDESKFDKKVLSLLLKNNDK